MPGFRRREARLGACLVGAACIAPSAAEAHSAFKTLGSFWSGALHVLTSVDQVGLLLGLTIWACLQRRRSDAPIVGALCVGSMAGSLAGWASGARFDSLVYASALMLLIGVAGAAALDLGAALPFFIAACCGVQIGLAVETGAESMQPALFALGAAIAAASVTSYGFIVVAPSYPGWVKIALRAVASWIAAIGLMVLALQLAKLRASA
jgi:urease accessory protein